MINLFAGATSGALASVVTTPMDVAKTLLQTAGTGSQQAGTGSGSVVSLHASKGASDVLRQVCAPLVGYWLWQCGCVGKLVMGSHKLSDQVERNNIHCLNALKLGSLAAYLYGRLETSRNLDHQTINIAQQPTVHTHKGFGMMVLLLP